MELKICAITQARYNSTRLPGKVLKKVCNGKSLLEIHLERIKKAVKLSEIYVATTNETEASKIVAIAKYMDVKAYCGSLENVLDRFYQIAKMEQPDFVVRLTSDCPLIDSGVIDMLIDVAVKGNYDYVSNTLNPTFPDGFDVEVFKCSALEKAWKEAVLASDKEHVTPFIWRNSTAMGGNLFQSYSFETSPNYHSIRLTVDEEEDFELVNELIEKLGDRKNWKEYVNYIELHPELKELNSLFKRNEGYIKSLNNDSRAITQHSKQ